MGTAWFRGRGSWRWAVYFSCDCVNGVELEKSRAEGVPAGLEGSRRHGWNGVDGVTGGCGGSVDGGRGVYCGQWVGVVCMCGCVGVWVCERATSGGSTGGSGSGYV